MGESKSRLARLLTIQPTCIYCGGTEPAVSIDHCPPIGIFDGRKRPKGLEFPCCKMCHEGTRAMDNIACAMSRLYPIADTEEQRSEIRKYIRALANNHREIALLFARHEDVIWWEGRLANVVHFPDESELNTAMNAFAARVGIALFYEVAGFALPPEASILCRWYSNYDVASEDFPTEFVESLGLIRTLSQGNANVFDQFKWAAARTADSGNGFGFVAAFRRSFVVSGAIWLDGRDTEFPARYRPGFLREFEVAGPKPD